MAYFFVKDRLRHINYLKYLQKNKLLFQKLIQMAVILNITKRKLINAVYCQNNAFCKL